MAPKRRREDSDTKPSKKQKKGFSVGPANLPDGTYKRRVQKIKKDLIQKAKIKKEFAKIKERELGSYRPPIWLEEISPQPERTSPAPEPTLEPHPDRRKLLETRSPEPEPAHSERRQHRKRPKPTPFDREAALAAKRKAEAETRRVAREEAKKQREQKLAERERQRRLMVKARGLPGAQRRLGKESIVLLERVKKLVGGTK